ncbi:hypothetical protein G9A89_001222 [Geosiphon pyriformis]|nr:hypothetical protein G9A89_001222 [Geosiphon pyriformis]
MRDTFNSPSPPTEDDSEFTSSPFPIKYQFPSNSLNSSLNPPSFVSTATSKTHQILSKRSTQSLKMTTSSFNLSNFNNSAPLLSLKSASSDNLSEKKNSNNFNSLQESLNRSFTRNITKSLSGYGTRSQLKKQASITNLGNNSSPTLRTLLPPSSIPSSLITKKVETSTSAPSPLVKAKSMTQLTPVKYDLSISDIDDDDDDDLGQNKANIGRGKAYKIFQEYELFSEKSTDRKELHHVLMKKVWKSLVSAPVLDRLLKDECQVLDVGCGTGAWMQEMAAEYPKSKFTGMDIISNFEIDNANKNAEFFKHDLLNGIPFKNDTFDLIHQSFLNLFIPEKQWKEKVIPELVRVCKPGGWIELFESDLQYINAGDTTHRLNRVFRSAYKKKGINPVMCTQLYQLFVQTNKIQKIMIEEKAIPLGNSKGEISDLATKGLKNSLYSARHAIPNLMAISPEEYDQLCEICYNEYDEHMTLFPTCRIWVQKSISEAEVDVKPAPFVHTMSSSKRGRREVKVDSILRKKFEAVNNNKDEDEDKKEDKDKLMNTILSPRASEGLKTDFQEKFSQDERKKASRNNAKAIGKGKELVAHEIRIYK